ncbi:MAG: hypothetical protein ACE5FH_05885 [Candidatus Zixiibacteriota bacterium]
MKSKRFRVLLVTGIICGLGLAAATSQAASVRLEISGPGAVNDSTIKANEKVSVELWFTNDSIRTGFTLGFAIKSPDIKKVIHLADSGNGLNENGDIKGFGGWQDRSVWDLGGIYTVERDWDGQVPELIGFGGVCVKQRYKPHELEKHLSFDLVVPSPGTLVIDSAFYPPGGKWLYSSPVSIAAPVSPDWSGPYKYTVIK